MNEKDKAFSIQCRISCAKNCYAAMIWHFFGGKAMDSGRFSAKRQREGRDSAEKRREDSGTAANPPFFPPVGVSCRDC